MPEPPANAQNTELASFCAAYVSALRKQFPEQPEIAQFLEQGEDLEAEKREHQFFLKRLRFRLREMGMSNADISQLEITAPQVENVKTEIATLSHSRTAMLVIHGIGQQNPYETLDQFARNLFRYLKHEGGIDDLSLSAHKIDHNDWTEAMIRLKTDRHGPLTPEDPESTPGEAKIDIYEYYWAPQTEDKISYKATLLWLIKTTLTPIKLLSQNIAILKDESDEGLTKAAILARELRRIGLIYAPVLLALVFLLAWLPNALNAQQTFKDIASEWNSNHPLARAVMTLLFAIAGILYWVTLKQGVAAFLSWMRQEGSSLMLKILGRTLLAPLLLTLAGLIVGMWQPVTIAQYFHPIFNRKVLPLLAALGFARIVQAFLKNFVGDVAVYVNADAKAKNYAARRAILSGATLAVTRILKDNPRSYQQIIVAGHSLGSVIAYDVLNEVMNRRLATADQIVGVVPPRAAIDQNDLEKIKGLITFGSPLDKVVYFFREYVPAEQSLRAQITSFLHAFRKRPSQRDYGIYKLQPYRANSLDHVRWLNAWSKQDPVSGMLHFYRNVQRQEFNYLIPIYAHLSYWEDLRFYEFFAKPMLLGKPVPVIAKVKRATA